MGNTVLVIVTALLSGIVATVITIWWQTQSQKKRAKIEIFTTLMSKRYEISAEESVEALNMIDVVFYKEDKVRQAWKDFHDATRLTDKETRNQLIYDRYLRLLEIMAESIGYKNIHWDNIKQYYYPVALSDKKRDEAFLRRVQIDVGMAQINKEQENNTSQINKTDELSGQIIMEMMKNPEGLLKLMEVAEKAEKFTKK